MFLKPFRVKTQTAMKGSDRKKLRADIEQQYPSLSCAETADMIPNKGDMSQVKIVSHSDENFVVYCYQKNPLFYEYFKKLFPTVYTLWKFPNILPVFTTYPPVFKRLLNGAELMLPGVEVKGEHHPKMFGNLQKGDLCLVRLKGNRTPVVLAEALLSGEDMYHSAMKGKGFHTLHIFGDHLWEMGDKSQPPNVPEEEDDDDDDTEVREPAAEENSSPDADEACQSLEQMSIQKEKEGNPAASVATENNISADASGDGGGNVDGGDDDGSAGEDVSAGAVGGEEPETVSKEEMDNLILHCFKCAVKSGIKDSDLPLLASNLVKGYMQPFCPKGKHLDLKKSSYKKLSEFLRNMCWPIRFITLSDHAGVYTITAVHRTLEDLRDFVVPDIVEEEVETTSEEKFEPPEIKEVLCVTAAALPLLSPKGYSKGSTLTAQELRQHVTDYVKTEGLQEEDNKQQVKLDYILADLALTKSEGDRSHLDWNTLFTRITAKLQPGCLIHMKGKAPVLKKGQMEPVKLDVEQRGGQKKVTIIQNLETFGIDPREFAQMTQRKVAGSASVVPSEKKNHGLEVHVQGNQTNFVLKQLLETYKIHRKYIQTTERAVRSKRR